MSDLHVIVMDMDGTLLNDNKEVSEYTKNVLRRQKEKGMKIGIASGRPILGVRRTVENLGLSDIIQFMVASNGAELYDVSDGEERGFFKLDVNTIFEIIDTYKHFDLNPYVYQGGDCYAVRNDSTIERAAKNNFLGIHLCDMRKEVTTPQSKLVLSTPPEKMKSIVHLNHRLICLNLSTRSCQKYMGLNIIVKNMDMIFQKLLHLEILQMTLKWLTSAVSVFACATGLMM